MFVSYRISFLYILILILFMFPIKFYFFPLPTNRVVLYILVLFMIYHIFHKGLTSIKPNTLFLFLFLFIILMYSFAVQINNIYFDVTLVLNFIEIFFLYPVAVVGLIKFYLLLCKKPSIDNFILHICMVIFLQSILMSLMFFFQPIKEFYNSILYLTYNPEFYPFRQVGFTGFSAYNMGLFLAVFPFLALYLLSRAKKVSNMQIIMILFLIFIVLFPALITSRSGILLLVFFIPFLFLSFKYSNNKSNSIKFSLYFLILAFSSSVLVTYFLLNDPKLYQIMLWSFDIFISFSEGRIPHGINVLFDMYWMPNFWTFLFGDGYYTGADGGYYMVTDAGYMRLVLYFGILGLVLLVSMVIFYLIVPLRYFYRNDKLLFYFVLFVFFTMLIVSYKGNILLDGNELIRIVIMLFIGHSYFVNSYGLIFYKK